MIKKTQTKKTQSPTGGGMLISVNGKIVSAEKATISLLDSGALAGFGVFETILAKDKFAFRLAEHLKRFEKSRLALGLRRRFTQREIRDFLSEALDRFPAKTRQEKDRQTTLYRRIRITLTGGATGRGLWGADGGAIEGSLIIIVQAHDLPGESARPAAEIVSSATSLHWLAGHKTLSRMLYSHPAPSKSRKLLQPLQILYNPAVGVTEFSSAALFVRRGSRVVAAPAEKVFPSICRHHILKHWRSLAPEFKLETKRLEIADLLNADEVVGVNSLRTSFALSRLTGNTGASARSAIYKKPLLSPRVRRFLLTH